MTGNAPCKRCEFRKVGCHADCEEYLAFKSANDERREMIHKNKSEEWAGTYYRTKRQFQNACRNIKNKAIKYPKSR